MTVIFRFIVLYPLFFVMFFFCYYFKLFFFFTKKNYSFIKRWIFLFYFRCLSVKPPESRYANFRCYNNFNYSTVQHNRGVASWKTTLSLQYTTLKFHILSRRQKYLICYILKIAKGFFLSLKYLNYLSILRGPCGLHPRVDPKSIIYQSSIFYYICYWF